MYIWSWRSRRWPGGGSFEQDFGVAAEVFVHAVLQVGDPGGCDGLRGERLVDKLHHRRAIRGGQGGKPMLFQRITFIAGEAVEALEVDDIGAERGGEGGEGAAKQRGDGVPAFLMHGVAGDQAGERGGQAKRFVAAADSGVAGDEPGLLHEQRATLVGRFEHQGNLVKQIEDN